jgi:hypothetical protein
VVATGGEWAQHEMRTRCDSRIPEAEARLHGAAHMHALWLLDDGREEEGQVHLLPTRKSQEWEAELQATEVERTRLEVPRPYATATAEKILELAEQAESLYNSRNPAEQRRLLENGAIELHL